MTQLKMPTCRRTVKLVVIATAFALVESMLVAGCGSGGTTPITPDHSAIVGIWTNPDGARLVFDDDGSFVASKMPIIDNPLINIDELPTNGAGTWSIEPWDPQAGHGGGLVLVVGAVGVELTTTGDSAHPNLYASIGDPDSDKNFSFTKQSD